MDIQLFNEHISLESQILQLCVRQRQSLTEERIANLNSLFHASKPSSPRQFLKGRNFSTIPAANTGDQRLESIPICNISLSFDIFPCAFARGVADGSNTVRARKSERPENQVLQILHYLLCHTVFQA